MNSNIGNGDDTRLYHTIVETKKKERIKIKGKNAS